MIRKTLLAALGGCAALVSHPSAASAIPVFAHRYGLSCQACHTTIPRLNELGEAFLADGYTLAGTRSRRPFPVAMKVNLAYRSEPDPTGLPKAVVDEVEFLTGGHLGRNGSYFAEVYAVDGGRPGSVREAWYALRAGALQATLGQFTLSLPVDPETFRETSAHYAIYDQTVGANPFNFFDPRQGVSARFDRGASGFTVAALAGHDKQSGIASHGIDRMISVHTKRGAFVASAYRYDGDRLLASGDDRFWRQGIGLAYTSARVRLDATVQNGNDAGLGIRSSGGFVQARYAFSAADTALVRYDGTSDTAFTRTLLVGASHRVSRNARLTLEETIAHAPTTKHTLSAGYLFAY
jgi:hypothetical protein